MRTVWRLCSSRDAALTGHGARLYGGRWNLKGTPLVYCSSTLSLAVLETLVHASVLPISYVAIRIDIPASVHVDTWTGSSLPRNWRAMPGPVALQRKGTAWARLRGAVAVIVPSAIVPIETNVLLNPLHPDLRKLVVHRPRPFGFDARLGS
jgi:RES domain-containing protein